VVLPRQAYTPWSRRLGAFLIDIVLPAVVFTIGGGIGQIAGNCVTMPAEAPVPGYCGWTASPNGGTLVTLAFLVALASYALVLAFCVWNWGYRQGKTGSSLGKSLLKFKVVSEKTWQPIGFGQSIARLLIHFFLDTFCYIGYLWPLWDPQRQTFADKIVGTACVPLTPQSFAPAY
jgi:uncharacterized RDD family membrane protein YckC